MNFGNETPKQAPPNKESQTPFTPCFQTNDDKNVTCSDFSINTLGQQAKILQQKKGCKHYQRNCEVQCSECKEFHSCRFCHDEAKEKEPSQFHQINRFTISKIRCKFCLVVQEIGNKCTNCNKQFAHYFCKICRLYDNDKSMKIFHCDKCGVCRRGDPQKISHCDTCGGCMPNNVYETHKCFKNNLHQNCPICLQDQFHSTQKIVFLPCGHVLHSSCFEQLSQHKYQCPLCYKSFCDMAKRNKELEEEIENTPMPAELRNKKVEILCNDCQTKCTVSFHILGFKCTKCYSYNTRQI